MTEPCAITESQPPATVIEARRTWSLADLAEIWRFRELFFNLTLRDVKVRYKQTILGIGWSVAQPVATMVVFAVFIGWMGKVAEGVEDYTLFVMAGVLPWLYFANAVNSSAMCLVANERLVTKIYFPRVILPASNIGAAFFDFLIGFLVLAVWIAIAGPYPTWKLVLLPVLILLLALTSLGIGLLLSALIATQRDFRHLLGFAMQIWMFATPAIYLPADKLPFGPAAQRWLSLNPVQGLVVNFRAAVLGTEFDWMSLGVSMAFSLLLFLCGALYFRRVEQALADTI